MNLNLDFFIPIGKRKIIDLETRKYLIRPWDRDAEPFFFYLSDETSVICRTIVQCVDSLESRRLIMRSYASATYPDCIGKNGENELTLDKILLTLRPLDGSIVIPFFGSFSKEESARKKISKTFETINSFAINLFEPFKFFMEFIQSITEGAIESVGFGIAEKLVTDSTFRRRIRYTTPRPQVAELARDLWSKSIKEGFKKEIKRKAGDMEERVKKITSTPLYSLRAFQIINFWKENLEHLFRINHDVHLKSKNNHEKRVQIIGDLIQKGILKECAVYGLCLETGMRCQNSIEKSSAINLPIKCEFCERNSMIWLLFALPESILSRCWKQELIPEMVLGTLFENSDWTKQTFVHKQISQIRNGRQTKTAEIDVLVFSMDDRVFFIEITSQRDLENVHKVLNEKIKAFEKRSLEYDGLFYFTSADIPKYYSIDDARKIWILGKRHLEDPDGNVQAIIAKKLGK